MFDNPNQELQRLQDQLLVMEEDASENQAEPEQEETDFLPELRRPRSRTGIEALPEEPSGESDFLRQSRRKRIGMLVIVLLLEMAALLAVIGAWLIWK